MKLKRGLLSLAMGLLGLTVNSQSAYTDSMLLHQHTYKKDLSSIIQKDTAYVRFYTIDTSYKIIASIEKLRGQSFFPMATSDGRAHQAIKYAVIKFRLQGKEYSLFAYQLSFLLNSDEHRNNFFIPFTDETSGVDSYGGGKYIDFVTSDISADSKLVVDFNKSYNPYCAFKSGYSCPIPPKENDLAAAVKAGEMNFDKKKH